MKRDDIISFDAKITDAEREDNRKMYNKMSYYQRRRKYDLAVPICEDYFETDTYKNGETDTEGYSVCCDVMGMCGMSGWVIFLIILIVHLFLAGAAAAFWLFYCKRKMGGRDEEKEIESTVDTANTEHDISVETY